MTRTLTTFLLALATLVLAIDFTVLAAHAETDLPAAQVDMSIPAIPAEPAPPILRRPI